MSFHIHIDTVSMGLPIVYLKGSFLNLNCCISSGSLMFAKVEVEGFPVYKGLNWTGSVKSRSV